MTHTPQTPLVWMFETTALRDDFLNTRFPQRSCTDTETLQRALRVAQVERNTVVFDTPDARLHVHPLTVTAYPKGH